LRRSLRRRASKYRNDKHRKQWQRSLYLASEAFGDLSVAEIDTPIVTKFLTLL
jgi:hypothetical protein